MLNDRYGLVVCMGLDEKAEPSTPCADEWLILSFRSATMVIAFGMVFRKSPERRNGRAKCHCSLNAP